LVLLLLLLMATTAIEVTEGVCGSHSMQTVADTAEGSVRREQRYTLARLG
jgi:Flp pilus assembly protein TadG